MTLTKAIRALGATALTGALLLSVAPTASADQVRDDQWANAFLDLARVGTVSKGDGVVVGLIDSGVDASHPDIAGSILKGYDPSGTGLNENPTSNHGTAMASIIVGHGHGDGAGVVGLAPGARILPIYKGTAAGEDAIPEGIRWAVEHGAKVINISQGNYSPAKSDPELTKAVAFAAQHDVLIVAAAGNDAREVGQPANEPGVLAVAALDKTGSAWANSNSGPEVLIAAPGAKIVAAGRCGGGQYCLDDGTSDATAYVSAAAALVRSKFPKLTAGQVANRLVKSAKAPSGVGKLPDPRYGYGLLSPYDALTKDIPTGSAQGPLGATAATGTGSGATAAPSSGGSTGGSDPGTGLPAGPGELKSSSDSGLSSVAILAVVGGGVILLVVLVVVVSRSRRRSGGPAPMPPQGQPPYGAPPAWPGQQPYGQQGSQPGYPPQQPYGQPPQQPYGNQPPQQQNPYQGPYGPGGNQPQR